MYSQLEMNLLARARVALHKSVTQRCDLGIETKIKEARCLVERATPQVNYRRSTAIAAHVSLRQITQPGSQAYYTPTTSCNLCRTVS